MRSVAVLALTALVLPYAGLVQNSGAATAQQVQDAIDKTTKYVYSQMKGNNWEILSRRSARGKPSDIRGGQWGGMTALCTYALLAAGENPQDPQLAKAIEFLRTADLIGTDAIALRSQVWLNIPKNDLIREAISKDAKLLVLARRTIGPNRGEYTFMNLGPTGVTDHASSEAGVLGLWACSDVVEAIPESFWTQADASWRADQGDDGSWAYQFRPGTTDPRGDPVVGSPSMTAAGLTTLFITQDFLNRGRAPECTGNIVDKNIDSGLKWMSQNFDQVMTGEWAFYGLYGVARAGMASGYKYFGDVDWYERGADYLLAAQNADGSFPPANPRYFSTAVGGSLANSCFALLFLSYGRAPVVMNKLQYQIDGKEADWNERPRDAYSITRWIGKETENTLNWQVSTMASPVHDWHDAPILYITGDDALNFTPEEQAKLKAFIEQGGLIMGSADCGKNAFADSFRKLGTSMFQNREFTAVGPADPIMHDEQFDSAKWRQQPTLLGLSNGARQLMLLFPDADPAKAWQMQQTAGKEELFQLAANIFLYAVDKEDMFVKGDTYIVDPDPSVKAQQTIDVARIKYDGNWDPEPGGWRRLSAVMHNGDSLDVNAVAVDPASDSLAGKKIAHLTGTDRFRLTTSAITELQQFIKNGGTLIVDAAGGKTAFADSAEKTLHSIFGDDAVQAQDLLPEDGPLYLAGGKLEEVSYRTFARAALGNLKTPRLRGITQGGRLVCIYSPEDLSVGLVGEPVDGILGYSPESATALMRKILLLASGATPTTPSTATPAINKHVHIQKPPSTKPAAKTGA